MPIAQSRLELLQIHKFLQCVRKQETQQIEKFTTHGVPQLINYSEPENGNTALHLAACANDEKMVQFLIDLDANPDMTDMKGRTPAMKAAELGHIQVFEMLVEAEASLLACDNEGKGVCFYCIYPTKRHYKCLEVAIDNGADVNNVDDTGKSVLIQAAQGGHEKMVTLLLNAKADPNYKNETTGKTALHAAASSGNANCVREILSAGANVDEVDEKSFHAAHFAAQSGHYEVLQVLSSYGANMGTTNYEGDTPLHLTAAFGHSVCGKYLIQRGCPIGLKNLEGKTARAVAKEHDKNDTLKVIRRQEKLANKIAKGGKPPVEPWCVRMYDWMLERKTTAEELFRQLDINGDSVLSRNEFITGLKSLGAPLSDDDLRKLANLHDKNRDDSIAYGEFLKGSKYIARAYMDPRAPKKPKKGKKKAGKKGFRRKAGKTKVPIPICTSEEGPRTVNGGPPANMVEKQILFTDTGRFDRDHPPAHPLKDDSAWYLPNPDKTYINIVDAAKIGDYDTVRFALRRGTNVDERDKYFKTPLMEASASGHVNIVKLLLEKGAEINKVDNFKWTALHHACHAGQEDIVKILVENNADIDAQTLNGGTPLMRAIEASRACIVQHIIEKGCKVQLKNRKEQTALEIAKAWADPNVLSIVQAKFDSLPPVNKKNRRPGTRRTASPPKAAPTSGDGNQQPQPNGEVKKSSIVTPPPIITNDAQTSPKRKGSIILAASLIAAQDEKEKRLEYQPKSVWLPQPTTEELLNGKEDRRKRYGHEIDFPDYKPPFQKNTIHRAEQIEKEVPLKVK
ncbi:Ankyrin repeat and EF-hand domain-containing protein 1 [Trichoplax sp. H2]|nr:Ankyrin repeat and EF-hand domain-containing protein 1 [Trichoplax sp. H2]|eukprot:RDD43354.1 Ankyrin repeat and EF-hand domain-containing protein 1 [Trichoplax sp. H2]